MTTTSNQIKTATIFGRMNDIMNDMDSFYELFVLLKEVYDIIFNRNKEKIKSIFDEKIFSLYKTDFNDNKNLLITEKKLKNDIKKCLTIMLENQNIKELLNIKVWDNEEKIKEVDFLDFLKERKNGDSGKIHLKKEIDDEKNDFKLFLSMFYNIGLQNEYKKGNQISPELKKIIDETRKNYDMTEDGFIKIPTVKYIEQNRATEIANEVLSSLILLLILKMFEANFIYDKINICGTTLEPLKNIKYDDFKAVRHFQSLDLSFEQFNDLSKIYFSHNVYGLLIKECKQYIRDVCLNKVLKMHAPMSARLDGNDQVEKNRIKKKNKENQFFIGIEKIINGYDDIHNEVVQNLKKITLVKSRLRWAKN